MKIVLFGMNGQLGWELQRALSPIGELHCFGRQASSGTADFTHPNTIRDILADIRPQLVFNAAAYTNVDLAETEHEKAFAVNAETPALIAREAEKLGALLVHYSTDYVFDGGGSSGHEETEPTAPLNIYGESKRAGEIAIGEANGSHLVFRTSWVYGAHGHNFLKTILRLSKERPQLSIVADQIGAPTGAELLADASVHAALRTLENPRLSGIYHLCAGGETSWHGYAEFVCREARELGFPMVTESIAAIPSSAYPQKARRPLNSRLNCNLFQNSFNLDLPDWRKGVLRTLQELKPEG